MTERLSPEHVDLVTRTLLVHDEAKVRKRGVTAIKTSQIAHHRTLLVQCAEGPDPEVRKAALQTLVRGHEPIAVEFLSQQLESPEADAALVRMGRFRNCRFWLRSNRKAS